MKKIYIIFFVTIFFMKSYCADYINKELNISLKYSDQILNEKDYKVKSTEKINKFNKKHTILITFVKLTDYFSNKYFKVPPKVNKEQVIEKLKNKKNIFFKEDNNSSHNFFKYNGKIIGEICFSLNWDGDTQVYSKRLMFLKDDNIIFISVRYYDKDLDIPKKCPQYFQKLDKNRYVWKDFNKSFFTNKIVSKVANQFYQSIHSKDKDAPIELIKLEEYFDQAIGSLKISGN